MADLSTLLGQGETSTFQPDARFADIPDDGGDHLPSSLSAMQGRMGGRMQGGRMQGGRAAGAQHAFTEEPAPDPIADARAQAYAQGATDTRIALEAQAEQDDALRATLTHAFERIDGDLAEQFRQRLMDTVVALCEATLAPLALDKEALARRVEKAAAMFARADDERIIRLHPDDLKLIRALLPKDWAFAPDPALPRGTIRVESRSGGVESGGVEDGPEQWRRAIIEALDVSALGDGHD